MVSLSSGGREPSPITELTLVFPWSIYSPSRQGSLRPCDGPGGTLTQSYPHSELKTKLIPMKDSESCTSSRLGPSCDEASSGIPGGRSCQQGPCKSHRWNDPPTPSALALCFLCSVERQPFSLISCLGWSNYFDVPRLSGAGMER